MVCAAAAATVSQTVLGPDSAWCSPAPSHTQHHYPPVLTNKISFPRLHDTPDPRRPKIRFHKFISFPKRALRPIHQDLSALEKSLLAEGGPALSFVKEITRETKGGLWVLIKSEMTSWSTMRRNVWRGTAAGPGRAQSESGPHTPSSLI